MNGLDIFENSGDGYSRVVSGSKWTVASLNYAPRFDERNIVDLERHNLTDETFVLLSGSATLIVGDDAERILMEPLKIYNVRAGAWHNIVVSPDARVLVVENADTSKDNTEYLDLKTRKVFRKQQEKAGTAIAVAVEPIRNFFPAEEYHQKYLDKNPGGYCHIPRSFFSLEDR